MDFVRYSDRHRTSLAHFLSKGKWDPAALEKNLRESIIEKVYQHGRETKQPVLCIIDDTIASKTRPSSQAVHPMEATSDHMSHLKGRMDYGYQVIGVMLACGELVLNYAILLYDKSQSKIDMVSSIANTLPEPPNIGYLLCDSWYTCDVEVFFRTTKGKLALDKYQLRSATGIRRFWLLMSLTHFLCCVGSGVLRSFSEGYEYWQTLVLRNVVQHVYNCGKNGTPLAMLGKG